MRLLFIAFILCSCSSGDRESVKDSVSDVPEDDGCPVLSLQPTPIEIEGLLDQTVDEVLTLSNLCKGTDPLTVTEVELVEVTGALSLVTEALPLSLEPGASTEITVSFTTGGYELVQGTLQILSDDPSEPAISLTVIGNVSPDQDGDGYEAIAAGGDDCDDLDDTVFPGARDTWYDGIDQDCRGNNDYDQDEDGFRAEVDGGQDCDDADRSVFPGAAETWYDGVDSNCDGADDFDRDGDGLPGGPGGADCDDTDADLGLPEDEIWYDGIDQDCDGGSDFDADRDGFDGADWGGDDCDDADAEIRPGAEEIWYDGLDQNCDGDDDYDADHDGVVSADWDGEDCDDADPLVGPDGVEELNVRDDDCDGFVDEDFIVEGDILVTELMVNPRAVADADGEYIELYNAAFQPIDLYLWTVSDLDGASVVIDQHLIIDAGTYVVLGTNDDVASNGGVIVDFVYDFSLKLNNGSDELVTVALDGAEINAISYDTSWPIDAGEALGLDPARLDLGSTGSVDAWCAQESVLPMGDLGSPGLENDLCPAFDHDEDGFSGEDGDCDDADATVFPGAADDWYDGIDQDCSGGSDFDADEDGADSEDYGGTDCDDADPETGPDADEVWYDGIDQDCSGGSDYDRDGDGEDSDAWGGDDCDDADPDSFPGADEVWYDGTDQDCSGGSDYDQDDDGYEFAAVGGDDCDDEDALVHPDAAEIWDGMDDDCDGVGDDAVVSAVASGALDGEAGSALGYAQGLGLGDLDGDDIIDMVVGSSLRDGEAGGAWLLSGADWDDWTGEITDLAFAEIEGGLAGNRLGSLGPVQGDLDGDGQADLLLAGSDHAGGTAASVWLGGALKGALDGSDAWATLYGADDDEIRALSHLDLDGTGVADVVWADMGYSTERGRIYTVLDGALDGGGVVSMATAYEARIRGATNYDYVGSSVGGGDVDGDGIDDLLLGAYGIGSGETGAVYGYPGGASLTGALDAGSGASFTITGRATTSLVGEGAAALGDLDGDARPDLVVPVTGSGQVAVWFDVTTLGGTVKVSEADITLSGGEADLFGASISVTDVDGDGVDELIVGAPDTRTPGTGSSAGEVFVFQVDGSGDLTGVDARARLEGEEAGDALGGVVLGGLDLDGDGHGDLLLSAWGQDEGGADAGRVYSVRMP